MNVCPICKKEFPETLKGACDLADHYLQEHISEREKEFLDSLGVDYHRLGEVR